MKFIETNIPSFMINDFFKPIRNKIDFSKLLLNSCKFLLIKDSVSSDCQDNRIKLKIDKNSRIFFYSEKNYYSISFPFKVNMQENNIEIQTLTRISVDSRSISSALSILKDPKFISKPSLHEYLLDYDSDNAIQSFLDIDIGIQVLEELFQFESCYIRYDYDEKHAKGALHPLNHLDINYSQYGSFKIGLNSKITTNAFEDLLDLGSNCWFIQI